MSDFKNKFQLPQRYHQNINSIWTEYVKLATDYKPINLGQGFPDFPPPQYVTDALVEVAANNDQSIHQYTRGFGHPRLIKALSKMYSQLIGRDINPLTEVVVTLGAYHAIFVSIMGNVDDGDEVIIIEPFFECYEHNVVSAGGIPKFIPLKLKPHSQSSTTFTSADWILDQEELQSLFNSKTKAIVINTPHNSVGKIFTYEELTFIADLCKEWNVLCIADEVYERLVYDRNTHIRMASLPGMWERTITIGSAGKTFGVTGWKLGWAYGPDYLISNLQVVLHNSVRAGNTILQEAVAICFEKELGRLGQDDSYFKSLAKELEVKRDFLYDLLKDIGMVPFLPQGGYFLIADWSPLEPLVDLNTESDTYKDFRFTKWMTKNVGVQGIPPSAFYNEKNKYLGESFVRYCFVKQDNSLHGAAKVLKKWKSSQQAN